MVPIPHTSPPSLPSATATRSPAAHGSSRCRTAGGRRHDPCRLLQRQLQGRARDARRRQGRQDLPAGAGVDLAGTVVRPTAADLAEGDEVLVHGHDLGVAATRLRGLRAGATQAGSCRARWPDAAPGHGAVAPRVTAALSVVALERHGLTAGEGEVWSPAPAAAWAAPRWRCSPARVRGGGEQRQGGAHEYLREMGASAVVGREAVVGDEGRRSAPSAGPARSTASADHHSAACSEDAAGYGAAVSGQRGNTGGPGLSHTVVPLHPARRRLLGIDSVACPPRCAVRSGSLATEPRPDRLTDGIAARSPSTSSTPP